MKVRPFFRKIIQLFKVFGIVVSTLFLVLLVWFVFSFLDTKKAVDVLPPGFTFLLHSESFYDSVSPLLDLEALDIVVSQDSFSAMRPLLFSLRSSSLLKNSIAKNMLSRKIDAAAYVYPDENKNEKDRPGDFFLAINLSHWSAFSRLSGFLSGFVKMPELKYIRSQFNYFEYTLETGSVYIRPYKNLLLLSTSFDLLRESAYRAEKKEGFEGFPSLVFEKEKDKIQILSDTKRILSLIEADTLLLEKVKKIIPEHSFSEISFSITDAEIELKMELPVQKAIVDELKENDPVLRLISKKQSLPLLLSRLPDTSQYYTLYNAGSLEEAKDAFVSTLKNPAAFQSQWETADSMSRLLFSANLYDLLFSWTGKEAAVFGLEGKKDPVFALHIQDERQRKKIFESFLSSIIIQEGDSHIYDGVKIPSINIPTFIRSLLTAFNIDLPHPFYLVKDEFIFFSNSPENLLEIYKKQNRGETLLKNTVWNSLSPKENNNFVVGLYYDLEKTLPFFAQGDSILAQVLQLYSVGRGEVQVSDQRLVMSLHAKSGAKTKSRAIHGFPIDLDGKASSNLVLIEKSKNPTLFWVEKNRTLFALDLKTLQKKNFEFSENIHILAADAEASFLWVLSTSGTVYKINSELETKAGFPVLTGEKIAAPGISLGDSFLFPTEKNTVVFVSDEGALEEKTLDTMGNFVSSPAKTDRLAAFYAKSFLGDIFVFDEGSCLNAENPLRVESIGFGSPAILEKSRSVYIAFIGQAGDLYIWKDFSLLEGFPKQIEAVFRENLIAFADAFFAIDESGIVYKIGLDGRLLAQRDIGFTAKNANLSVHQYRDKKNALFINPDASLLFAFDENLEELSFSPLSGMYVPVFVDLNGDKKNDMLVLSADNKINAWMVD